MVLDLNFDFATEAKDFQFRSSLSKTLFLTKMYLEIELEGRGRSPKDKVFANYGYTFFSTKLEGWAPSIHGRWTSNEMT